MHIKLFRSCVQQSVQLFPARQLVLGFCIAFCTIGSLFVLSLQGKSESFIVLFGLFLLVSNWLSNIDLKRRAEVVTGFVSLGS